MLKKNKQTDKEAFDGACHPPQLLLGARARTPQRLVWKGDFVTRVAYWQAPQEKHYPGCRIYRVFSVTFECKHCCLPRARCYATLICHFISIVIIFNFIGMILNNSTVYCHRFFTAVVKPHRIKICTTL